MAPYETGPYNTVAHYKTGPYNTVAHYKTETLEDALLGDPVTVAQVWDGAWGASFEAAPETRSVAWAHGRWFTLGLTDVVER